MRNALSAKNRSTEYPPLQPRMPYRAADPVRMKIRKVVGRSFLVAVLEEDREAREEPQQVQFGKIETRR